MIQIPVRQQQAVAPIGVGAFKVSGVVAAAGESRSQGGTELTVRISRGEETGMWRPAEGTRAFKRRVGSNGNAVGESWNGSQQSLIVVGKGALHHRIQIGVATTQEEIASYAALDSSLNALCAKCLGVHSQLIGIVGLQKVLQFLLLRGGEIGQ